MRKQEKRTILDVSVDTGNYKNIVDRIIAYAEHKKRLLVFPLATHTLIEAVLNKKLRNVLNSYDILTPDSQWIAWSLKWIYNIKSSSRVYGPDLMIHVLSEASKKNIPLFFYGTNDKTLFKLVLEIKKKYNKINVTGYSSAPYRILTQKEKTNLARIIEKSGAKIVFISLSSPGQVGLGYELSKLLTHHVIIPVGAAFDFIAKTKKQAPPWMQRNGLEWLYRLFQEPQRLWWRYLKCGSLFLILIAFQKLKLSFQKNNEYSSDLQ